MVLLAGELGPAIRAGEAAPANLERSYWVHASLASDARHGYWGTNYPAATPPTEAEIANSARLLAETYAANRLYLIYHGEISSEDARRVFTAWRRSCPAQVELVPTLVLRAYDKEATEVFEPADLQRLVEFLQRTVNPTNVAVYDVYQGRDLGRGLSVLARATPGGVIRVGLQPGEAMAAPVKASVEDTWSAVSHARSNEDWRVDGAGAPTLRSWVAARNEDARPVAWDLIAVAWDYEATPRGSHPGYDDAAKNRPLPAGRNRLAAREILGTARREILAGFSSDLFILDVNSRHELRDGAQGAFYETLKRGRPYGGFFSAPLKEIAAIYGELKSGRLP